MITASCFVLVFGKRTFCKTVRCPDARHLRQLQGGSVGQNTGRAAALGQMPVVCVGESITGPPPAQPLDGHAGRTENVRFLAPTSPLALPVWLPSDITG